MAVLSPYTVLRALADSGTDLTVPEMITVAEAVEPLMNNLVRTASIPENLLPYVALGHQATVEYMRAGRKIQAIKEVRVLTSCSLIQAKRAVESAMGEMPYFANLRPLVDEPQTSANPFTDATVPWHGMGWSPETGHTDLYDEPPF